jgi:hypothetical protein
MLVKLLNSINSHKAIGPDGIPARLLHEYASYIAPALTKIFQISVNTGTIQFEAKPMVNYIVKRF